MYSLSEISDDHINKARMQDESVNEIKNGVFDALSFLVAKIAQMLDSSSGIRMKSPSGKCLSVFVF